MDWSARVQDFGPPDVERADHVGHRQTARKDVTEGWVTGTQPEFAKTNT